MIFENIKINYTALEQESLPLNECLAKTFITERGQSIPGKTVFDHCLIVGHIARELLNRLPAQLRSQLFPEGSELIAALHDIGKISPTFQEKIYRACEGYTPNSKPELVDADPSLEKEWGGHAGVSQVATEKLNICNYIPKILGQHHGYSPNMGGKLAIDAVFGGPAWQDLRQQLIEKLRLSLGCDLPLIQNSVQARAIAGLTSVADWIGSGSFFGDPKYSWETKIKESLDHAGFIVPNLKKDLEFGDVFKNLDGSPFAAKEIQIKLFETANQPGVYILEAPMGLGKTEAALYAAYQLISSGEASGLYFALPTQLTSNKILDRVNDFLEAILTPDCIHREALLLHGKAWLRKTEMGEAGLPGGSWFNEGKRGILAPFGVGTIDQALMAVMNVKHGFVRAYGLAGKVVILDEVHSYDTYTGTILEELVRALRILKCTVIILSATLTCERRQLLMETSLKSNAYPLITSQPLNCSPVNEIDCGPLPDSDVSIQMGMSVGDALNEALLRAEECQQVLWIENTIDDAQAQYKILAAQAAEMGIECGLLHSRFLSIDRERIEKYWVDLFGKSGRKKQNSQGRILVGTQVLEQSLDIDADFMISRFCPTDMLLQRIGRLWRHLSSNRPQSAKREAWVLSPSIDIASINPERAFGKTAFVYSPYVLCRSLEIWQALSIIRLPGDIRSLVEATYRIRDENNQMANLLHELEYGSKNKKRKGKEQLKKLALVGLSQGGKTLPESKASTRYSEIDRVEVLLLRSVDESNKSFTLISFLNNEKLKLPKHGRGLNIKSRRQFAIELMKNTLQVADYQAPDSINAKNLTWLSGYMYLGNGREEESLLRVAIVDPSGRVRALDLGPASTKYRINYTTHLGYQTEKLKEG